MPYIMQQTKQIPNDRPKVGTNVLLLETILLPHRYIYSLIFEIRSAPQWSIRRTDGAEQPIRLISQLIDS